MLDLVVGQVEPEIVLGFARTYDAFVAQVVRHAERFGEALRDLHSPTSDDVTILRDGRRLDTAEKVRAFVAELRADQARPGPRADGGGEPEH